MAQNPVNPGHPVIPSDSSDQQPILRIESLAVSFAGARGGGVTRAVVDVSLAVFPRQTLAVVGESGSGKSVTALSVLRLIPAPPARYDGGRITWSPPGAAPADLLQLTEARMRQVRGGQVAMIFQEPMTSLNPVYTIGEQVTEAILLHQPVTRRQAVDLAAQALADVGIADPRSRLKEYPHQLSGGMRQRVMIAMALSCRPRLLLADEPTTALDVTIQAQILELLRKLQDQHGMSVLLITHDLGVVAQNADVVAVMYAGRVVECAAVEVLFERPLHPYTRGLLASMPRLGRHARRLATVADGAQPPPDFPGDYVVEPHRVDAAGRLAYHDAKLALHEVEPAHWVLCAPRPGHRGHVTFPAIAGRRAVAV